jgi:hypothetical protein
MRMKLFVLAFACVASGCLWANEKSGSVVGYEGRAMLGGDGHVEGGAIHGEVALAGVGVAAEANLRDAARVHDPARYHTLGAGVSARASLFGILATDHAFERYLDFGGEAGASVGLALGVPPSDAAFAPSGWLGGWVEVGTVSLGAGYVAITGGVRRELMADPFLDRTQLMIGLAWRQRETLGPGGLPWHD